MLTESEKLHDLLKNFDNLLRRLIRDQLDDREEYWKALIDEKESELRDLREKCICRRVV